MELKCSKCGQVQSAAVSRDADEWHFTCAKCGSVERMMGQPDGLIVMAFADDSDPQRDRERFVEDIEGSTVRTWYTFDSIKAFMDAWRKMAENPDGMWYWVLYNGKCICSGACDPYDEDIFVEEFDLDENDNPVIGPHWKEAKYSNWKKCSCCGAEVQQAEDYERSGLYQFCPRCGKRMTTQEPDGQRDTLLCECLFDITIVAAHLLNQREIDVDDSRELFHFCLDLAWRFDAENPDIGDGYMDVIEELAFEKLAERFGRKSEEVETCDSEG